MGGSGRTDIRRYSPPSTGVLWIAYIREKKPDRKKNKTEKINYALQHGLYLYVDEERLGSFMTEVSIMPNPAQWFAEQINGLVSIRRESKSHERVNALLLACIHWDIFFDYDKKLISMHPTIKGGCF